eukprot:1162035-Pelagomonas_calceolata.AAC.3
MPYPPPRPSLLPDVSKPRPGRRRTSRGAPSWSTARVSIRNKKLRRHRKKEGHLGVHPLGALQTSGLLSMHQNVIGGKGRVILAHCTR